MSEVRNNQMHGDGVVTYVKGDIIMVRWQRQIGGESCSDST